LRKGESNVKKKIGFVDLDVSLARWLCSKLQAAPPEAAGAEELLEAVEALLSGEASSLMLELGGEGSRPAGGEPLTCGGIAIDPKSRRVTRDGAEIPLTPKEFDILYFLARNRGVVFTKEQIYQAVWEGEYLLDDSNIMAFIRKLRKKIEPNPDAPEYIQTVWGIGYKFNDKL
jgi:DNA-binding response OmpR family regulator